MNLLFWKKKKTEPEGSGEETRDRSDDKTMVAEPETQDAAPHAGLFARFRAKLAAVGQRLRRRRESPAAEGESPVADEAPGKTRRKASEEGAPEATPAVKSKKRLLLLGMLGMLVLLAAGGGFAAWKWLQTPAQRQEAMPHGAAAQTGKLHTQAAPAAMDMQAQIEALKKQNQEMQAQIEAIKKGSQSEPHPVAAAAESKPGGKTNTAAPPPGEGVLIISGKDTKASAQALKQVIEEMNANEGRGSPK